MEGLTFGTVGGIPLPDDAPWCLHARHARARSVAEYLWHGTLKSHDGETDSFAVSHLWASSQVPLFICVHPWPNLRLHAVMIKYEVFYAPGRIHHGEIQEDFS